MPIQLAPILALMFTLATSVEGQRVTPPNLSPAQRQAIDRGQQLLRHGRVQEAAQTLQGLQKAMPQPHPALEAALAWVDLAMDQPHHAALRLKPYLQNRIDYDPKQSELYLAGAEAQRRLGQPTQALRLFNWVATGENHGRPLVQVRAVMGVGQCLMAMERLEGAQRAMQFALHNLDAASRHARQPPDRHLKQTLEGLLRQIRRNIQKQTERKRTIELDPKDVGQVFMDFRKAQYLRLTQNNPRAAQKIFARIQQQHSQTIYAEASSIHQAQCWLAMGQLQSARETLIAHLAHSPRGGSYHGEAMFWLGLIALEYKQNTQEAARWFRSLDLWIQNQRAEPPQSLLGYRGVRPKALGWVRPTRQRPTLGDWQRHMADTTLLNRDTSGWYLDDLQSRCVAFRGYCLALTQNPTAAMDQYQRLLKLDRRLQDGDPLTAANIYTRLKFSIIKGRMIAKPDELALYTPAQKRAIQLGDFYFITEQFDRCLKLHRRLAQGVWGALNTKQLDLVRYMQAMCLFSDPHRARQGPHPEAFQLLVKTMDTIDGTWAEHRALFKLGQWSRLSDDPKVRQRGNHWLLAMAQSDRHTAYTHEARLMLALDCIEQDRFDDATRLLRRIPARDKLWYQQAAAYLNAMQDPDSPVWTLLKKKHPDHRPAAHP